MNRRYDDELWQRWRAEAEVLAEGLEVLAAKFEIGIQGTSPHGRAADERAAERSGEQESLAPRYMLGYIFMHG